MPYNPSIGDLIIATLASGRSSRRFREILSEREFDRCKIGTVNVALSRLKRKGWVKNSAAGWNLTEEGRRRSKNKELYGYIPSPFPENKTPGIIVAFDIPEKSRAKRYWLRNQLKIFGYEMLQQSLWIGPGPLPPSFFERLDHLHMRKHVKSFKITKKL